MAEHNLDTIDTGPVVMNSIVGLPDAIANELLAELVKEAAVSVAVRVNV
jgi:hypothetical protein